MARPAQTTESIAAKRTEILFAAQQVLETSRSIDAVTLRAVAKVLGWSYATTYRYFASKEELLTALRTNTFRWMQSELEAALTNAKSGAQHLEQLTKAYITAGLQRPDLYQLMFFDIHTVEQASNTELDTAKRNCLDVCTRAMSRAQEQGELSDDVDPLTAAHVFWVSSHGIVSLHIAGQLVMGRELDEITHTMLNLILSGLSAPKITSKYFQETTFLDSLGPNS